MPTTLRALIFAALAISLTAIDAAEARVTVRVLLVRAGWSARAESTGPLRIYSLAEERLVKVSAESQALRVTARGDRIRLGRSPWRSLPPGGVRFRAQGAPIRLNGALYRGAVDIAPSGGRIWVINIVRLEDYLRGGGQEIPSHWPAAALRAQTVAARTFTLLIRARAERRGGGRPLYHLTAGTGDQVYDGVRAEHPAIDAAVTDTSDLVLTAEGGIALTFFHAASGGHTETAHAVWPSISASYLRATPVPSERKDPSQSWESRFRLSELRRKLAHAGHRVGEIHEVTVHSRTSSGRAKEIQIAHRDGRTRLFSSRLRQILGYRRVRSTLFTPERDGNEAIFRGRGYGHGTRYVTTGSAPDGGTREGSHRDSAILFPGTALQRVEQAAFPDEKILVPQRFDDLSLLLR